MANTIVNRSAGLTLSGLRKVYGSVVALDRISLDVPAGSLLTLLGPSGCGKSTLLRIIAGFVNPTEGQVLLDGKDIVDVAPNRRNTAMVFQNYALFPHMSVLQNVMFGLRMRREERRSAERKAMAALDMVRLAKLADRFPSQLSGGQQQRTALARALVTEPKILLLDEPFGALDRAMRDEMQIELRKLQQEVGVTTICVTHDQGEAMTISDLVAVMRDGRLEQFGPPLEIYDRPRTTFIANFMGTSNIFEGEIEARSAQTTTVRLPGGQIIATPSAGLSSNGPVCFSVRPNAIELTAPIGRDASCLSGKIDFVTNLGSRVVYDVSLRCGRQIKIEDARGASTMARRRGETLDFWISPEACTRLEA